MAVEVAGYVMEGHDMPVTFQEMYRESGGTRGQPGGYRCPDHGYSYYVIESGSVRCPRHDQSTAIPCLEIR